MVGALGVVVTGAIGIGLTFFVLANLVQSLLLASAVLEQRRHVRASRAADDMRLIGSPMAPPISILAPAYNEAPTIEDSVRALLTLAYPRLEVVVVNDGSTDETLEVLRERFDLVAIHPIFRRTVGTQPVRALYRSAVHPELVVIDKENGGKADALNAALNVASSELVCAIDADTLIEPDALLRIVRPFLDDDRTVASGGTIRVANGSRVQNGRVVDPRVARRWLAGVQTVEYLRAFLFGRLGWNRLGGNLIISGAFGLFRRDLVLAGGGYLHDTVGEDMELVARVRRRAREAGIHDVVTFVPDPVAWTEVPEQLGSLGRQRDRWQRGLADVLTRHRDLIGRRRYGALGLIVMPYFLLVELLGPVFELLALLGVLLALATGAAPLAIAGTFLVLSYGWALLLSLAAVLMEQVGYGRYRRVSAPLLLAGWAVLEHIGYRQLTLLWRIRGMWRFARGRTEWGAMTRRGFGA